jgi:opacity protein-like surface antigen
MKALTLTNLTIVLLGWMFLAVPANAQDAAAGPAPDTAASPAVQVTPFVSIDSRGSTPLGAAFSFPVGGNFWIETEVGYRRGEGNINALTSSANLLYDLPPIGRVTPYLATGAGLAQYGAPIVAREGSVIATEPRVALEVNAGGGLRVPVDDAWGMRTDARWFKSFGRHASEHWRVAQGVSFDVKRR